MKLPLGQLLKEPESKTLVAFANPAGGNPVIARIFRELGLVEQWGSGIRRIFAEAARQGLPEPVIKEIATGVRLRIWLAQRQAPEPSQSDHPPGTGGEQGGLSRLESRLESRLAAKVVVALRGQATGKADLAKALGHATVSGELHKQIRRLVKLGIAEMTLPDKPQSRLQKYRLTSQGKRMLESPEN